MARLRPFGPPVPWAPRLLLFAALLLGIVTMHTLGHPGGGHGSGGHGGSDGHGGAGTHASATHSVEHSAMRPADAGQHGPAVEPVHADRPAVAADAVAADPTAPGGMDPMAVCLAVLAGWTLLLLAGPLLRRSGDAAAEVRARLLRAVRALPPPGGGRTLLTRLSVLRQ
ncbi:hypothetical protein ACIRRH_29440 [Kitasatospora sp. NPDC101235]|uniref:hypothetical protein n=1 Tax=Kitasatospora sp. NPDC101235 TaxID=3364101 RepID=UPI00381C8E2B